MIALTSPYLWYTARATGVVALVLLTLTLVLGSFVSTRVGGNAVGRFEINELHRSIALLSVVFVAIHVTVTVLDSYVPIGLPSILIPFTSAYRRVPVAIGTIALDLMLATWITSLFKERLRYSTWRFVHWFSWICFATAVVHGFLTGTDAHRTWSIIVTVTCLALVLLAGLWRVTQRPQRAGGRTAHSPLKGPESHARTGVPPRSSVSSSPSPRPLEPARRVAPRGGASPPPAPRRGRPAAPPPAPPRRGPR